MRARTFALWPLAAAIWVLAMGQGCNLINGLDNVKYETGGGGQGGTTTTGGGGNGGGGSGGDCTPVDDGKECTDDVCEGGAPTNKNKAMGTECAQGVCDAGGNCVECNVTEDCDDQAKICKMNECVDVTCTDLEQNGAETDVDCGGPDCPQCQDGQMCLVAGDCQSGVCEDQGGGPKCQAPSCTDSIQNGDETDQDCGGSCAALMPPQKCADGEGCAVANDCQSGVCDANGACLAPECGDGVVNGTDLCDDGNMVNGDGCDNNCSISECGNGVADPFELCDDGNMVNGDGCDNNCSFSECGNGQAGGTEECDDGNFTNGDGCDDGPGGNCTITGCGNGVVTGTEQCDDGNQTNGDGCDDAMDGNCTVTACGNGVITPGELCDDGNATNGDGCDDGPTGNCTPSECGNGVVTGIEECDDGNITDGDGCDNNCTTTACGNGIVSLGEVCDDGNVTLGDGCDDGPMGNCTATACGNGVVTGSEFCDDGNMVNGDGCDNNCTAGPECGDGITNALEQCDDGNMVNGDGCDNNCTPTGCGNGIVSMGEVCDDNNLTDGDGCDSNCTITACGNGIATGTEACDDGNPTGGDGCSAACTIENIESEPNNACAAADGPFTPNPSVNVIAAITPVGDVDFISFTLPGPGVSSVRIETFTGVMPGACTSGNDTLVQLFAPNCTTQLASDDDDGLNACSLIDPVGPDAGARKLAAGTYFVRVNEFGDNLTIANYNVNITILSTCGNGGMPEPTEACDDGNLTSGDGCDANCTLTACGNGAQTGAEACDDGNTANGDGCSAMCTIEPGYTCTGTLPTVCTGVCGNGTLQANEGCEDGNVTSGDCCSATCQLEACETEMNSACGTQDPMPPFALNPPIAYAGGAITPAGDLDFYTFTLAAPASVRIETFTTKVGQCTADTLLELRAPNCTTILVVDDDDGVNNCSLINPTTDAAARNLAPGTYTLRIAAFSGTIASYGVAVTLVDQCGNGAKGAFEACDDGDNDAGDGCSPLCGVEPGYTCVGTTPSVCSPICGDGVIAGPEQCDDADTTSGDGCSATCTTEPGFSCVGQPSVCTAVCGDGFVTGGEQCDDANTNSGDGCSATCTVESGFTCTGMPSVCVPI